MREVVRTIVGAGKFFLLMGAAIVAGYVKQAVGNMESRIARRPLRWAGIAFCAGGALGAFLL